MNFIKILIYIFTTTIASIILLLSFLKLNASLDFYFTNTIKSWLDTDFYVGEDGASATMEVILYIIYPICLTISFYIIKYIKTLYTNNSH